MNDPPIGTNTNRHILDHLINDHLTEDDIAALLPNNRIRYWRNRALVISAANRVEIIGILDSIVNLASGEADKGTLREWKDEILARIGNTPEDPGWNYFPEENMSSMRNIFGNAKRVQEGVSLV